MSSKKFCPILGSISCLMDLATECLTTRGVLNDAKILSCIPGMVVCLQNAPLFPPFNFWWPFQLEPAQQPKTNSCKAGIHSFIARVARRVGMETKELLDATTPTARLRFTRGSVAGRSM